MTTPNGSVSKNWLIGTLTAITLAAGGGWGTYLQAQVTEIKTDQKKDNEQRVRQAEDIAVVKEKLRQVEKSIDEIKVEQRMQTEKLDLLLRRGR